jgi:hypothetical protein
VDGFARLDGIEGYPEAKWSSLVSMRCEVAMPEIPEPEPAYKVETPPEPERPWILRETSDYLREDTRTTRRRVERGELHPIRLPNSQRLLFDPAVVRQFVADSQS